MIYGTPTKAENKLERGKQYTSPVTLGEREGIKDKLSNDPEAYVYESVVDRIIGAILIYSSEKMEN